MGLSKKTGSLLGPPARDLTLRYRPASKRADIVLALSPSSDGMTMALVAHEMSFEAQVASGIVFMEICELVAVGSGSAIIPRPKHPTIQKFMAHWARRSMPIT
jgi:ABC-type glutathione transport system ATPase component